MKPYKKDIPDKQERKSIFSGVVTALSNDGLVNIDDNKIMKVVNKKRKASDIVDSDGDVEERLLLKKISENGHGSTNGQLKTGNSTILLFYAYCNPQMTRSNATGCCNSRMY